MKMRLGKRPAVLGLLLAAVMVLTPFSERTAITAYADEAGVQKMSDAAIARVDRNNMLQWGIEKGYLAETPKDSTVTEVEAKRRFYEEGRAANGMNRFIRADRTGTFTVGDLIGLAYEACEGVSAKEVTSGQLRTWANQQGFRSVPLCNFGASATRCMLVDVLYHMSPDGAEVAKGVLRAPYFNQVLGYYIGKNGDIWHHGEWGTTQFSLNGHTLGVAGCGFTVTAMALSYYLGRIVPPVEFMENGQYTGDGAQHSVGEVTAREYGVPVHRTGDISEALVALRQGYPVMCLQKGPSFWSQNGHYILLVGEMADGTIATSNPGLIEQTYRTNGGISYETAKITDTQAEDAAYTIFGIE